VRGCLVLVLSQDSWCERLLGTGTKLGRKVLFVKGTCFDPLRTSSAGCRRSVYKSTRRALPNGIPLDAVYIQGYKKKECIELQNCSISRLGVNRGYNVGVRRLEHCCDESYWSASV
jgi:hypothetical protein